LGISAAGSSFGTEFLLLEFTFTKLVVTCGSLKRATMKGKKLKTFQIKLRKTDDSAWAWDLVGKNGKVVASSTESYKRRSSALQMATKIASEPIAVVETAS